MLVLFVILFSYINPAVNFVDAWRDSHAQRSQLQRLQHQHSRLAAKAASLNDSRAAVEAARKLGMVAPDEHSFVIRGLRSAPSG